MKAGDLVHVPAGVTMLRNIEGDTKNFFSIRHFKTKMPKKALFIEVLDYNNSYCCIEYGENTWTVNVEDIILLED